MDKRILMAGASGEVGQRLLQNLIADNSITEIHLILRTLQTDLPKKVIQHQVDFSELSHSTIPSIPAQIDQAFCCLGSTIKKAGSKEAFKQVDHDYVIHFAKLAQAKGCTLFSAISSVGADASSNHFYLQTKGKMEASLIAMNWPALCIFRPGLLLGPRSEFRFGEVFAGLIMKLINPILVGPLQRYRATRMSQLAQIMAKLQPEQVTGVKVFENKEMIELIKKTE